MYKNIYKRVNSLIYFHNIFSHIFSVRGKIVQLLFSPLFVTEEEEKAGGGGQLQNRFQRYPPSNRFCGNCTLLFHLLFSMFTTLPNIS